MFLHVNFNLEEVMVRLKRLVISSIVCVLVLGLVPVGVRAEALPGNWGFESGTLDGWTIVSAPDHVGVSQADQFTDPYWGNWMGVLGLPRPVLTSQPYGMNTIRRQFTATMNQLKFAYNVFCYDYPPFDNFSYVVKLYDEETVIASWSTTSFGPSTSLESTGWQPVTVDVSAYRNRQLTIEMSAGGTRDTSLALWAYVDVDPDPIVTVTAGPNGTVTPGTGSVTYHSSPSYLVKPNPGYLIDTLTLDGTAITAAANKLSYTITLPAIEVPHTIAATFRSMPDVLAPTITFPKYGSVAGVTNWVDGAVQTFTVHASPFPLQFTLEDNSGSVKWTVKVNGTVVVDPMGIGTITYMLALTEGRNDVEVTGADGSGNWTSQKLVIYLDSMAPALSIDPLPSSVSSSVLPISGSAIDAVSGLASLTINGESVIPFLDGSFSEKLALTQGDNAIVIEAKDKAGNITSQTFTVKYGTSSSTAPSSLYVVLTIGSANMEVNGMTRTMDAAPFIRDGRTLLPIRALIEALGGSVQWNASTKTATVALGSRTVALTIGSKTALVNGKTITLDVAPMIVKGRTFLPLRAVAENIGLDLAWEPVSRTISLTYWP